MYDKREQVHFYNMTCPHGEPFPGSATELHEAGLQTILELVAKYNKTGRNDAGYKAARKFATKTPDLVDTFMIAFLACTGVKDLLENADRPRALRLAQVISAFEKRLYGSASAADVEHENLVRFYNSRIPCSCLDEMMAKEPTEEEEEGGSLEADHGICAAKDCGACKPLSELMACAACKSVFYWYERKC